MKITALVIQQDYQSAQTIIWYSVNGEKYGVRNESGSYTLLDRDGCPIESRNDHERVLDVLMPYHENLEVEYAGEDGEINEICG